MGVAVADGTAVRVDWVDRVVEARVDDVVGVRVAVLLGDEVGVLLGEEVGVGVGVAQASACSTRSATIRRASVRSSATIPAATSPWLYGGRSATRSRAVS